MCGFVGYLDHLPDGDTKQYRQPVQQLCQFLEHRGPDGEGLWSSNSITLGHRRLAIIDTDDRALQPMLTTDHKLAVVFNGAIYNFRELRAELESLGYTFRTKSDTEVLLHGWRAWGEDLPKRLNGMFAFAIWDDKLQCLFLCRDRFGKKPLYFFASDEGFLFGSEIKALIQWPSYKKEFRLEAIHDYLNFGYCVGEETVFKGIKRFPPSHWMRIDRGKAPVTQRYWSLSHINPEHLKRNKKDIQNELLERINHAVTQRLVADVPVGAFLSGGVDSSAVVASMATHSESRIKTFSSGFAVPGYDETGYAKQIAERYQTEHYAFQMDIDLINELPKLIWHYGEPYSDSSAIVTYALAKNMREHVKVGLSGDGGDEILLGYQQRYLKFNQMMLEKEQLGHFRKTPHIHPFRSRPGIRDTYTRMMARFRNEHLMGAYDESLLPYLFTPASGHLDPELENADSRDIQDKLARADCGLYLVNDLLVKTDIATMANGLETRSPFLDHELADWCASLPQSLRVYEHNGSLQSKALLKQAMEDRAPHNCLYREKMGFGTPVFHWMKHGLKDFVTDTLLSNRFAERSLIRTDFINKLLHEHYTNKQDHTQRLWALVCLELWFQTFIDGTGEHPLNMNISGTWSTR